MVTRQALIYIALTLVTSKVALADGITSIRLDETIGMSANERVMIVCEAITSKFCQRLKSEKQFREVTFLLHDMSVKVEKIRKETSAQLEAIEKQNRDIFQQISVILDAFKRVEYYQLMRLFSDLSRASIFAEDGTQVTFDPESGNYLTNSNGKLKSEDATLYLGDIEDDLSFKPLHLKKMFADYKELASEVKSSTGAKSKPKFSLTSDVAIPGFKGVSFTVTTTTLRQGFNTSLDTSHFELKVPLKFDNLRVNNVSIVPTFINKAEVSSSSTYVKDTIFYQNKNGPNAITVSGTLNEPYAGLSSAMQVKIKINAQIRHRSNNIVPPPNFKQFCIDNYKGAPLSEGSPSRFLDSLKSTKSVLISPADIVAKQQNGELKITPLLSRMDCRIKRDNEKLTVKFEEDELLSMDLFSGEHNMIMSPQQFFTARSIDISVVDSKSSQLGSLVKIPGSMLKAINRVYIDTITAHELAFMDEEGILK